MLMIYMKSQALFSLKKKKKKTQQSKTKPKCLLQLWVAHEGLMIKHGNLNARTLLWYLSSVSSFLLRRIVYQYHFKVWSEIILPTFQIRQEYARYLEEHHLVEILMWSLFKLMPANPDKMFDISPNMSVKGILLQFFLMYINTLQRGDVIKWFDLESSSEHYLKNFLYWLKSKLVPFGGKLKATKREDSAPLLICCCPR